LRSNGAAALPAPVRLPTPRQGYDIPMYIGIGTLLIIIILLIILL
jgi:hypothetical protein